MFGEGYSNTGEKDEFKPASRSTRPSQGHKTSGPPAAAVAVAAVLSGGAGRSTGGSSAPAPTAPTPPAARNALRDSDDDEGSGVAGTGGGRRGTGGVRLKSVAEIVAELDEDHDMHSAKGGFCSRMFIPFLVVTLLLVALLVTVWTSGTGEDDLAQPRVALFIIEGLTGTAFHSMVQSEQHLPNIAALLSDREGVYASCPNAASATCARAEVVEDDASGSVFVYSGSSIASILSGVPPPQHGVRNDTLDAYAEYATKSKMYPSVAKRVTDAGRHVTVIGTSHLLNSFSAATGRCSHPGVLDMECAVSKDIVIADVTDMLNPGTTSLECLAASTCNAHVRKIKTPTNTDEYSDGHAEMQFTRQLKELFGGLALTKPGQESAGQNVVADNLDESLLVFHFDALAARAGSAALPAFEYSASSPSYVAQAYLIDAMVGQVLAYLQDRSQTQKENWLVVGLSDHGGHGKAFTRSADSAGLNANQAIAYFMSTLTTNAKEYIRLKSLSTATSQLDVLPTVLRWLNIAPFDDATQAAVEGRNESYSEEVDAHVKARGIFQGTIKGICSSGLAPTDCV